MVGQENAANSGEEGRQRPNAGNDRELVDRAVAALQAGVEPDRHFKILFDRFYRPLLRFFARKGFSVEDCLDLTQETFVGIFKSVSGYRGEARFETWLYKVATTTYLKRLRSSSAAMRSGEEVGLVEVGTNNERLSEPGRQLDAMLSEERQMVLHRAIDELSPQMRRCLVLRVYHELSYAEIATVLRLKIDTVKAHLFQARKRLRDILGECWNGV